MTRELANFIFWAFLVTLLGSIGTILFITGLVFFILFGSSVLGVGYVAWWITTWNQRNAARNTDEMIDDSGEIPNQE